MSKKSASPGRSTRRQPLPRELVWTRRAEADLEAIGKYIARDDANAANDWIGALLRLAESAARMPLAGRAVPELRRKEVRELLLRNYRLVYRISTERVEVLTVFEAHKLLRISKKT